jgi:MFS transporter, PAT family, beta-lactamase induction signal transducer AmpG
MTTSKESYLWDDCRLKFDWGTTVKSLLQVFQSRKMAALLFIGFSSGLPILLILKTLQSWMSDAGTDLSKIGWYGSLVGFPYAFKYLWSPLLDRYAPPFLGRRKGWLLIIQSLLVLSIGTMALQDPAQNLDLLAINSVIIAFLGASLDIVADAYRTEVLTEAELPVGASIFTTGYRIALIVAFAGASKLFADVFQSWQPVYLVMAGFMLVSLVLTLLAPTTNEATAPETLADAVVLPFADFFQRRGLVYGLAVLLFIVSYKLSDAMMNSMSIPFLKASCFTQVEIGNINGLMGMIAAIVGALVGGVILTRMSIYKGLWIFGSLQALGIIFYYALAQITQPDPAVLDLAKACQNAVRQPGADQLFLLSINAEQFFGGMESSAFVSFLMSMCRKSFTATQIALLSSLMALSKLIVAPAGDWVKGLGWSNFFLVTMFVIIPSLMLLIYIARLTTKITIETRASVFGQLIERLGDLSPELVTKFQSLSLRELENLSDESLKFEKMDNLIEWFNPRETRSAKVL